MILDRFKLTEFGCLDILVNNAGGWVTGKIYDVDGGSEAPAMTVPVRPL